MVLPLSQVGGWLLSQCISMRRIYALLALLLISPISTAGEIVELSVTEADGEYRLRIVSVLDAPSDYVYNVITDYKHAYRINPSITEVEILPTDRDDVVRVRNLSQHWVGPICLKVDWVGDIVENSHGQIKVKTVPELSNFESGNAVWEIRPQGERTWLFHESSLKPKFFVPPLVGDNIMKHHMKEDTIATFNRIECHAKIMFEMDIEQDPELLRQLLKQARNCISPRV